MRNVKKVIFAVVIAACFAGAMTACHTINGAGQDVQAGGQAVSNTAAKVSPY